MKTFMFPGQGSQSKGMGEGLFDQFKELTDKADAVLGYSIKELCLEDPDGVLNQTQYTQPALYTVNALSYLKKTEETGEKPDCLAGHSLGEFNALTAAECFDFETGLKLVQKRGELMGQVSGGGMAAVLNASKEEIEKVLQDNGLDEVFIANYNSPSQIVVSGSAEQIEKAREPLKKSKARVVPLNTSGAFHSRFMADAMEQFRSFLEEQTLAAPQIPVIANVTARPYEPDAILDILARQIANTVQWCESVQYLMALARHRSDKMTFEEVGPGEVLTGLVATIERQTGDETLDGFALSAEPTGGTRKKKKKKTASGKKTNGAGKNSAKQSGQPAGTDAGTRTDSSDSRQKTDEKPSAEYASKSEGRNGAADRQAGAPGADAEEKVRAWNEQYPVGTKVKSTVFDYDELETRTEAVVLFGHRAAVYMKDFNGYFDLDELKPL